MQTMDDYRAGLVGERLGGFLTAAEAHARELVEGCRRAHAATGEALYAWSALSVLLRPGADLPLTEAIPLAYAEPIEPPNPMPALPAWIAAYLRGVAERLTAPLCQVLRHRDAAGMAWCRRQFGATGEELYLWVAVRLLELRDGAELPEWIAAALFRVARDLDDAIAGRDPRRRPRASNRAELLAWQARERRWPVMGVAPEELLALLGFRRSSRDPFARVHAQMVAASDFPTCFRRRRAAAAIEVLPAFGIDAWRASNPVKRIRRRLLDSDAAFAFDAARLARQEAQRMREAGRNPPAVENGTAAACRALRTASTRYAERRAAAHRRFQSMPLEA